MNYPKFERLDIQVSLPKPLDKPIDKIPDGELEHGVNTIIDKINELIDYQNALAEFVRVMATKHIK